jgi:hypothetical protein
LARAKKTERADARRRYRAQTSAEAAGDAAGGSGSASGAPAGRGSQEPAPTGLGGILASIKRPNVAADLRAAPSVLRARPWILAPFGLVIVGAALAMTTTPATGSLEATAVALLLGQPTLLYFLVGYLAPRGSYIFGAVLGLAASALYVTIVLVRLDPATSGAGDVAGGALSYVMIQAVSGALFAGFASWYREFLRSAGARNRERAEERRRQQEREARRPASKPAATPPKPAGTGPKPATAPRGATTGSLQDVAPVGPPEQSAVRSLLNRFRPGR